MSLSTAPAMQAQPDLQSTLTLARLGCADSIYDDLIAQISECDGQIVGVRKAVLGTLSSIVRHPPSRRGPPSPTVRLVFHAMCTYFGRKIGLGDLAVKKAQIYCSDDSIVARVSGLVDVLAIECMRYCPNDPGSARLPLTEQLRVRMGVLTNAFYFAAHDLVERYAFMETVVSQSVMPRVLEDRYQRVAPIEPLPEDPGWFANLIPAPATTPDAKALSAVIRERDEIKARLSIAEEALEEAMEDRTSLLDRVNIMHARLQDQSKRIDELRRLNALPLEPEPTPPEPKTEYPTINSWDSLFTWIDGAFAGRIHVTPSARKRAGKSPYCNWDEIRGAFALLGGAYWLTSTGHHQGETVTAWRDQLTQSGFRLSPVGNATRSHRTRDQYFLYFDGQRLLMDQHLAGVSSFDPQRCLRIYFTWHNGQIIVGYLPGHLGSHEGGAI